MNIEEIKKLKDRLEADLADLIIKFEDETTCQVERINLGDLGENGKAVTCAVTI